MDFSRIFLSIVARIPRALLAVHMYLAAFASIFIPQGSHIVDRRQGARSLAGARRVAVFLHYDRHGRVRDYVVYYLSALRKAGFEIVFVSNSKRLGDDEWARVLPFCALMLRRRNLGHDFGAYRDAIAEIGDPGNFDEIILANDSVYGPLQDLAPILERCDAQIAPVWGMTDSWDRRYHLQSYFVLFKREALVHPAFAKFWRSMRLVPSRTWVIGKYEIGMTQAMLRAGLRCSAVFPYRRMVQAVNDAVLRDDILERTDLPQYHRDYVAALFQAMERGAPLNPTHCFWDYLVGALGCPFIKRDLLLRNPTGVPFVNQWEMLVRRSSDYDADLIVRDIELGARRRSV